MKNFAKLYYPGGLQVLARIDTRTVNDEDGEDYDANFVIETFLTDNVQFGIAVACNMETATELFDTFNSSKADEFADMAKSFQRDVLMDDGGLSAVA